MTQNENIRNDYKERINNVLDHIQRNLDKPLDLKSLALVGNFSQFHFHRIFKAYLNESLGVYIKRIRLEKAAQLLIYSNISISEISFEIGYETPSSFTSAFNKHFGVSPKEFRNREMKKITKMNIPTEISFDIQPTIKTIPSIKIAFIRTFGSYQSEIIGKAWDKLLKFAAENNLFNQQTELLGISYDNPEISQTDTYQYNACITIQKEINPQGDISIKQLQGGRYAVFTYKGSYENLNLVYDIIFKKWLMKSSYELRDTEIFDKYLNTPKDTKPNDLLTKIHIPIK